MLCFVGVCASSRKRSKDGKVSADFRCIEVCNLMPGGLFAGEGTAYAFSGLALPEDKTEMSFRAK